MARRDLALIMIKPEAFARRTEIEEKILGAGFSVEAKRRLLMNRGMASQFYKEKMASPEYEGLLQTVTSGDMMCICVGMPEAVVAWKHLLANNRKLFGNAVHGSESPEAAEREVDFIFPHLLIQEEVNFPLALQTGLSHLSDEQWSYMARWVVPVLQEGLAVMYGAQPSLPRIWLISWLRKNNPMKQEVEKV